MNIIIFGATGSIGQNTLDVIRNQRPNHDFRVLALTGNNNIEQLIKDAIEFSPERVVTANHANFQELKERLAPYNIEICSGEKAILETARMEADWVMSAIVGFNGVSPTLEAVKYSKIVAIANKETLVCAGKILMETAERFSTILLPVDSEHNAIFQCLKNEDINAIKKVILTASGGPFRKSSLAKMESATVDQALAHPTWKMGHRITIDSATMFNKALELIEAKYFFNLASDQLDVVVHPQSIIHSMVSFHDNSILAQLGPNDMRCAIAYTLNYPLRKPSLGEEIDFAALGKLTFEAPDFRKFPALRLVRSVLKSNGGLGVVFNAAKEIALDRFISGEIGFLDMSRLVEEVLMFPEMIKIEHKTPEYIEEIILLNNRAREIAKEIKLH